MGKHSKSGPYTVESTDAYGSTYAVTGKSSKQAGRSMAYYKATGMVPAGPVKGRNSAFAEGHRAGTYDSTGWLDH